LVQVRRQMMIQTATAPPLKLEDLFTIIPINGGLYMRPRTPGEEELTNTTLSQRELEVLQYVADGNSNKMIGNFLRISEQTVKNHLTSILSKLQANDRTHAVVIALRQRWISI
jgi:two-component system response regulator DegU